MNDREEIYPASIVDSLSDYASTAPDDESEVDHTNLPPRLRMLQSPDTSSQPLPEHIRSQSLPYPPISPSDQYLTRSNSTRVIPSRTHPSSRRREKTPPTAYASASHTTREYWQPPPPYTPSDSGSSSSSTPASSSSYLPRDAQRSTSSLIPASAYPAEKSYLPHIQQSSSAAPRPAVQAQGPSRDAPVLDNNTSAVHSSASRPPITPRNASAPELHPPPPSTEVPPRPSTVPIAAPSTASVSAPPAQRKRSKNTSISAVPRDLDRIDELDESDPLGFAWHHDGPYEAIAKTAPALQSEQSGSAQKRTELRKRKPVQYDSVTLGVSPGQIFPSNSQYQPPSQHDVAQLSSNYVPMGSPPTSPRMQVPVQRRVPPSGVLPPSPMMYNNMHMDGIQQAQQQQAPTQDSHVVALPPQPTHIHRSHAEDAPQPSPRLPNPHSPHEAQFPTDGTQSHRSSPPRTHALSAGPSRPELPSSNVVPHPDIPLPPQQHSSKSSSSFLPRHLPKKLVMPAPLQQANQHHQQQQTDNRGTGVAHVEVLAQRHASVPAPQSSMRTRAPSARMSQPPPSSHQQHARAQDIPMSQGPKVLRKRHTTGGAPIAFPPGADAGAEIPASNTTAALFAARVRFADPPREETKEERKRREKEEARREKEKEKMKHTKAKEQGGGGVLGGLFLRDQTREAEAVRERAQASAKTSSGRKLSKRR
ncbi:hypothetical protein BC628DRAFT_1408028 [Trametes gibbosa]|nr:hypothetical protein BC628DRAFT_1408028 [Trametes gibbosa]